MVEEVVKEKVVAPVVEPVTDVVPTDNLLERAEKAAEVMTNNVEEMRKLTERQERMHARDMLGGRAEAGKPTEVKKEETSQEYSQRILRGDLNDEEKKRAKTI